MSTQTPTRINLAELAMTQQETISKQSRVIIRLLTEVAMFRELTQAEEISIHRSLAGPDAGARLRRRRRRDISIHRSLAGPDYYRRSLGA